MSFIKDRRIELGLKQEEVAEAMEVSRTNVSYWENGINMPRANKLIKLAQLLKCSVNDLLYSKE